MQGPDANRRGRRWMIDGRDTCVPAGTAYTIHFQWSSEKMSIRWEQQHASLPAVTDALPSPVLRLHRSTYSIVGSFSAGAFVEMLPVSGDAGSWECSFRIGNSGAEEFQIARDEDWEQLIYPAERRTVKTSVPVRGPDDMGSGKKWIVAGTEGDKVRVRFQIVDARITLTVCSDVKGHKVWHSVEGWSRHRYSVVGSWTKTSHIEMVMDQDTPGVFKACGCIGGNYFPRLHGYAETFQIVVDADSDFAFYPMAEGADGGESIVLGPDNRANGRTWTLRSAIPQARFEIRLDLSAVDRRKMVTWSWLTSTAESSFDLTDAAYEQE